MTKKELEQYRSVCAEIRETEEKIKENTVTDAVSGSDSEYPYTKRKMSISGLERSDYNSRLLARRRKLRRQQRRVEEFVDGIDDSLTRRIFRMRYIDGEVRPSWQWIAFKIGHHDESYPRRIHKKYLKNSKKI